MPAYTQYRGPEGATVAAALPMFTMAPLLRSFIPGSTMRVICTQQPVLATALIKQTGYTSHLQGPTACLGNLVYIVYYRTIRILENHRMVTPPTTCIVCTPHSVILTILLRGVACTCTQVDLQNCSHIVHVHISHHTSIYSS